MRLSKISEAAVPRGPLCVDARVRIPARIVAIQEDGGIL